MTFIVCAEGGAGFGTDQVAGDEKRLEEQNGEAQDTDRGR